MTPRILHLDLNVKNNLDGFYYGNTCVLLCTSFIMQLFTSFLCLLLNDRKKLRTLQPAGFISFVLLVPPYSDIAEKCRYFLNDLVVFFVLHCAVHTINKVFSIHLLLPCIKNLVHLPRNASFIHEIRHQCFPDLFGLGIIIHASCRREVGETLLVFFRCTPSSWNDASVWVTKITVRLVGVIVLVIFNQKVVEHHCCLHEFLNVGR